MHFEKLWLWLSAIKHEVLKGTTRHHTGHMGQNVLNRINNRNLLQESNQSYWYCSIKNMLESHPMPVRVMQIYLR